ncbi:hypothetical protein MYX64_05540 [Nitrospinae bacterium AH_259_B05_G02_I21]|nr:hypothetical protein [Nitrospinae bacterium AH_259_B05_G02_I21]
MFVIFAGPQQHGGRGTRYYANDGAITDNKSRAKKFDSFAEAEEFAKAKNIKLTATTYIGKEDFTDFEIQMGS